MLKNGLATLMALLLCGATSLLSANLVHESDFNGPMFGNPVTEGDVSRIWAVGPNLYPGEGGYCCGYWNYSGDGRLLLSHGPNNWDDPYYELDMGSVVNAGDTIELEFVLEPRHNVEALAQYTEILVTGSNLGNNGADSRAQTDVIFRLRGDFNYRMRAGFHSGTDGFAYVDLPEKFDTVDEARVIITYNEATTEWKAFLKLDDGRVRQIGSTIVKARTKNTIRVTNEMAFADGSGAGGRERPWNLYSQALRIYDAIQTTGPDPFEPEVGELLRNSRFDRDPTRWSNFFYPLDMRDVNGMFVPAPGSHAYDGLGNWVVNHPGTTLFPNASVTKISTQAMSAEWVLHVKPNFTATGNGQMLNFKVDGNPASFFVGNYSGGGLGTWSIMFGEGESPNPANGALQTLPVEELTDLVLIINYDAVNEQYNGFYSINGAKEVIAHPANPVSQARSAAGSVEFQWQTWAGDTDPFSVAMADYAEYAGVVTFVEDPPVGPLVHESLFNGAMFANPVDQGDVSRIWAIGANLYPGEGGYCCGYWNYTGDGRLLLSHGPNNWDDPYYEFDMDSVIDPAETVELEFVLEPRHNVEALAQYTEILVTGSNLGNNGVDSRAQTDVIFRLRGDFNYRMRAGFHSGTDGFAYVDIPEKFDTVDEVKVVITYDEATTEWKAYLKLDDGRVRQIGSPIVKARTKNTIRVTNEMAFADGSGAGGRERPWNLYSKAMRIFNEIQTAGPDAFEPVVGELLRNSRFDRDPTRWNNFFYPLDMRDVNGMFVPAPGTHAYDGFGNWVVNHPGTALFPNASITKISTQAMSAEWVLHAKPYFTATGNGQMLNFKVDGNPASFFVGNYSGGGLGTWSIMFGEGESPGPANGALQIVPVEDVDDLILIINYNADTQEYRGFYSVNGGDLVAHPANPVAQARSGAGSVEFQWQNWAGDTDPFSVAMADYAEYAGAVTQIQDPVDPGESLVHESTFNQTVGTNPVSAGDVSRIWAVDGSWTGGIFGHYTYTGEGRLALNRPEWNWDDPYFEYDVDSTGINPADSVEMDFVFYPKFHDEARTQNIEILVTDPNLGNNGEASRSNADVILRWWVDFNYRVRLGFRPSTDFTGGYTNIPQKADEMDEVRIIVTYNQTNQQWRAFYQIDGGWIREFPSGAITKARTKSTIRVTNEMQFAGGTGGGFPVANENERSWSLEIDNMRIFDAIQTANPDTIVYEVGDVLRHSRFDRNPALSTDFFLPINVFDVNGMFVPSPMTHAYDGLGSWVISHPGDNPLNGNNNINKYSNINDPTEWRLHIKPTFTTTGIGQQFNWKLDGNAIAMYVGNRSGDPEVGTWGITFGEFDNIFAPNPGNVAFQTLPVDQLVDLELIVNYNPATEQYNGYYRINNGEPLPHPANPVNFARTAQTNIESQYQVWRTVPSTSGPFTIGMHYYQELYGIVTEVVLPGTEKDSMWIY